MARMPKPWFDKERRVWKVTISGRRFNLGKVKKAAMEEFHRLMRQPAQQKRVSSDSLAAVIDAFLEWVHKHRAPDTYEWYRYLLQRFVERYPDMTVSQLKPFHAQEWADSYDISQMSRRNHLRSLKRSLSWATKQGYIELNPIQNLELPSQQHREVLITDEEYAQMIAVASEPIRELLVVTWETGCRPQESLRVEARHVDTENQRWLFKTSESKGRRMPRVVYLTDEAMHITRRLMLKHPEGPIFRNSKGHAWTTEATNNACERIRICLGKAKMKQLGKTVPDADVNKLIPTLNTQVTESGELRAKRPAELRCEAKRKLTYLLAKTLAPRYSLYAFRHSWATHALRRGVDSVTVSVLMGHADPSTLARVYQHLSQNPKYLLDQAKRARG